MMREEGHDLCMVNKISTEFEQIQSQISDEEISDMLWYIFENTDFYVDYLIIKQLKAVFAKKHQNKLKHNILVMTTLKTFNIHEDILKNILSKYL